MLVGANDYADRLLLGSNAPAPTPARRTSAGGATRGTSATPQVAASRPALS